MMKAVQAGRALCQGLLGVAQRAAVLECSSAVVAQQWPSVLSRGFSTLGGTHKADGVFGQAYTEAAPAAGLQQQIFAAGSRTFASLPRLPPFLQQQHTCNSLWQQHLQQPRLPCQPLAGLASPHMSQSQQQLQQLQQLLPSGVRHFVLMPRRIKYRKAFKGMGFNETICPNTRQLAFGLYGVRAMEHCRIPARTLEAARRTLRRSIKKTAMLWIRVTPNVPVTSKPAEVRMGKGKGSLDYWAAPIRPGQIIFEMDRCSRADALAALHSIQAKMPIKVGFVEWN